MPRESRSVGPGPGETPGATSITDGERSCSEVAAGVPPALGPIRDSSRAPDTRAGMTGEAALERSVCHYIVQDSIGPGQRDRSEARRAYASVEACCASTVLPRLIGSAPPRWRPWRAG